MRWRRYAIYALPEGALGAAGAAWLGWDAREGRHVPHPSVAGLPRSAEALTERPRCYGFHATIKPPFRLAEGRSEDALAAAFSAFCAATEAGHAEGLEVGAIGPFLALRPEGSARDLSRVAAAAVEALDAFRAPPSDADLARRRAAGLTDRQEALLTRWGYPYVMEEFRFHVTLTGPLPPPERDAAQVALAAHFAPFLPSPYRLEALALLGEDEAGRFHAIHETALSG
jgi:putative phosphonate metabolism protein